MSFQNAQSISLLPVPTEAIRQRRFVNFSGATGQVIEATNGADAVGVSLESSPDSDTAGVELAAASAAIPVAVGDGSIVEVESGNAAVAIGANIATDAAGLAITAAAADAILGRALSASPAATDGVIITVLLSKAARVV